MLDHRSPLIKGHIGNRSTARVRRYATKVGDSCDETGDYEVIASRRPINAVNDARLWHPWLRINRVLRVMLTLARGRRSHANRLNLTGGGRASVVRQAVTTPLQEHLCPPDAPSTGEHSRERRITQPDARLDERDGAGDRIPNRRLVHRYS